ncbi:MAG: bifunctional phosphoribosylaminoimidazolecarboxamide formyltransferase/IMP cyclohydrolase [Chloroflexota bacterium]|nr:bifunctional phosphoribosylaminoimidazolecarboxamide formyltransferase/IMP cyclohydrolase [Chloroflexota bacterium]
MRALLSTYDKTGLVELASGLLELGFELISTGGSLSELRAAGIDATAVADVTGFPEILDGRVKTLHPAIHAGLLARADLPDHRTQLDQHGFTPIDLVAINLYPFEETVARPGTQLAEALEQIDIGGPAMIRAAAKNHPSVLVLTDPADYPIALDALRTGTVDQEFRRGFAAKAFGHVSTYDALVAEYLCAGELFPEEIAIPGRLVQPLRYGENPHQRAAAYSVPSSTGQTGGILDARQIQGKELSYNNLLDANAAYSAIVGLEETACCIVKHTIPCGLAIADTARDAFRLALAGDPVSAFGGIVAVNRMLDSQTAEALTDIFFEVVIAPGFDAGALDTLARKKSLRLLELPANLWRWRPGRDVRSIAGGLLVQDSDTSPDDPGDWRLVTDAQVPPGRLRDLRLAWHAVRFVKSNAIVLVKEGAVVGVGPGQPNRVDSVRIALQRAGDRAQGSVLAGDAFFPFADGIEVALDGGVEAIVQPGGSVRDEECVVACNNRRVPMLFTGRRHFLH